MKTKAFLILLSLSGSAAFGKVVCSVGPAKDVEVTQTYKDDKMSFTILLTKNKTRYTATKPETGDGAIQIYASTLEGKSLAAIIGKTPLLYRDFENDVSINCKEKN